MLLRQPFPPDAFDEVILGCVSVIADEMNPARIAALRMGMGEAMTAFTVQINCGSGMQSIDTAYQYIREGHSDLILAGGTDALSWSPLLFRKGAVDWYAHLMSARNLWQRLTALAGVRPAFFKPVIGLERGLAGSARFVMGCARLFQKWADDFQAHPNQLPRFDSAVAGAAGGDPNIVYYHSYWRLAPDEALVIDATPPECDYWNFQLSNHWLESLDYRYWPIHLNKATAKLRPDGSVRIVVAHEDPGLPIDFEQCSNGEYDPEPLTPVRVDAERTARRLIDDAIRKTGVSRREFLRSASALAICLASIDGAVSAARNLTPGLFYPFDPVSRHDTEAARAILGPTQWVFDVQGHLLEYDLDPSTRGDWFWGSQFPQARCEDEDDPRARFGVVPGGD